mgnify:FL=1
MESQKIVDATGKTLAPLQFVASPALQFDGFSHVTIFQDIQTKIEGSYTLSTTNGFVYLDVTEPDGTDINYQVLFADGQTLKLVAS